jgi:hypothetical protein
MKSAFSQAKRGASERETKRDRDRDRDRDKEERGRILKAHTQMMAQSGNIVPELVVYHLLPHLDQLQSALIRCSRNELALRG